MKTISVALLCLLAAGAALAQERKPDPKLHELDFFAHDFACNGVAYASPIAPEHPTSAKITTKWQLDGYWLAFSYAEEKNTKNPTPFRVSGYFGYDPQLSQLVIGTVDNGGGYSTAGSSGWSGDELVFEGPWHMGTTTATGRDTFTKTGPNAFVHVGEIQQNGQWIKLDQETCTRK